MTKTKSLLNEHKAYYLVGVNNQDQIVDLDGGHDTPEGVAQAKKLFDRLGMTKHDLYYLMIKVSDVPKIDVEINEKAAEQCREMLELGFMKWN